MFLRVDGAALLLNLTFLHLSGAAVRAEDVWVLAIVNVLVGKV